MVNIRLPSPTLPKALELPDLQLKPPSARFPTFKPIVVPPTDLQPPEGVEEAAEEESETQSIAQPSLRIPIVKLDIPVPETAVVVTAVTTAVVAVATTTVTQSLFEPIKKKVQKQLQAKVNKWKENRKKKKDSSVS